MLWVSEYLQGLKRVAALEARLEIVERNAQDHKQALSDLDARVKTIERGGFGSSGDRYSTGLRVVGAGG